MSNKYTNFKLGRKAGSVIVSLPHISKFMRVALPKRSVDWTPAVKSWPLLANDSIGDCTAAGCLHLLQLWLNNNGFEYIPTDAEAIALYSATSNYPKSDDGAPEQEVLTYWSKQGIQGPFNLDTVAFAAVDPKNLNEIKYTIEHFGGCYFGIELPISAQIQDIWDASPTGITGDGTPGSWGGHCVVAVAYDDDFVTVVSWGKLIKIKPAFLSAYLDQAYAVISQNWLADSGISPPGLDWAMLMTDLNSVRS